MPTVNGYTAERMKEIEDETIVNARIQNDDLILIRKDGSEIIVGSIIGVDTDGTVDFIATNIGEIDSGPEGEIVANLGSIRLKTNGTIWVKQSGTGNTGWREILTYGKTSLAGASFFLDQDNMADNSPTKAPSQQSVKSYVDNSIALTGGTVVCTSTTRPVSPTIGLFIYETDTGKHLTYYGPTTGWKPPWNQPWGVLSVMSDAIDRTVSTAPSDLSGSATPALTFVNGRRYRFTMSSTASNSYAGPNEFVLQLRTGASGNTALVGELPAIKFELGGRTAYNGSFVWQQSGTVVQQLHLRCTFLNASSVQFLGATRSPNIYTIEDIGSTATVPSI